MSENPNIERISELDFLETIYEFEDELAQNRLDHITYSSIAAMQTDETLNPGDTAIINGAIYDTLEVTEVENETDMTDPDIIYLYNDTYYKGDSGEEVIGFVSENGFIVVSDKNTFVTPEMFGAVGDGVHDDTDAVQNAISSNSLVCFSYKKVYLVTTEIEITTSFKKIIGNNATIKLAEDATGDILSISSNLTNITIDGLTLLGNGSNQNGILIGDNVLSLRFHHVTCQNNGKSGVKLQRVSYGNQFVECNFTLNGEYGFDANGDGTIGALSTTDFLLCRFTRNTLAGITMCGSVIKFYGGWFEENDIAVVFNAENQAITAVSFFGVDIEANKTNALKFISRNNNVIGNIFYIGGQIVGSATNENVIYYDATNLFSVSGIQIDTNIIPINGNVSSTVNTIYLYTDKYPLNSISDSIHTYFGVEQTYVTDSAKVQNYILGSPTYVNANSPYKYVLKPNECITIKFNSSCYCVNIKYDSTSANVKMFTTIINNGKKIANLTKEPTVSGNQHTITIYNDVPYITLKNVDNVDTEISNVLWTGRLPYN